MAGRRDEDGEEAGDEPRDERARVLTFPHRREA
jgi:hypothetical protein